MTAIPGERPLPESKLSAGLACWRMDHLLVLAVAPCDFSVTSILGGGALTCGEANALA